MNVRLLILLFFSICLTACQHSVSARAAEQSQHAAQVNRQIGLVYLQQNQLIEAEAKLLRAQEQDPKSVDTSMALAYTYQKMQQPEQANIYYERALSLDHNNPHALKNYGAFLCQQGQYQKGMLLLNRARDHMHPSDVYMIDEDLRICVLLDQPTVGAPLAEHLGSGSNAVRHGP